MSSPSKIKGNTFEREVVNQAKEFKLKAIRAYASNGMSLGEAEDVDVKIENLKGQCKRRKRIAKWVKPSDFIDAQIVRENNGESFVIMRYEDWLLEQKDKKKMIKELRRLQK